MERLRDAATNARGLDERIRTIAGLMTPHVEGCALMRRAIAQLQMILSGLPDEPITPEDALRLHSLLATQYTMAEERAIFEASFRGVGLPLTALPTPAAAASDDIDDLLF